MTYVLDTNVYFHTLHDPAYLARYRSALLQVAPHTFLSSVVRLELVQGARGDVGRARIGKASLIVRTARRIGAIIVTENVADFDAIRPYLPHHALTMEGLASQLGARG